MAPRKKYSQAFRSYVQKKVGLIRDRLWLGSWRIDIVWDATPDEEDWTASISADPQYLEARVKIYDNLYAYWREGQREYIFSILMHEVCHIFQEPNWSRLRDRVSLVELILMQDDHERCNSMVTRAVSGLFTKKDWER